MPANNCYMEVCKLLWASFGDKMGWHTDTRPRTLASGPGSIAQGAYAPILSLSLFDTYNFWYRRYPDHWDWRCFPLEDGMSMMCT